MNNLINKQDAIRIIDDIDTWQTGWRYNAIKSIKELPSAQPTLDGYNIEHLILIAKLLEKENLPPEKVSDALYDISRVIAIVKKEFEETMKKAVEQCIN